MVRIRTDLPNTSVRREDAPQWRAPPRINTQLGARQTLELRRKARLPVHRPSACSGVKALRNTSDAKAASRQAPLAFRSLDPFRALREPDCRRRDEKRPFPLRTKNSQHNPKQPLDRKSPIQVSCELPCEAFSTRVAQSWEFCFSFDPRRRRRVDLLNEAPIQHARNSD